MVLLKILFWASAAGIPLCIGLLAYLVIDLIRGERAEAECQRAYAQIVRAMETAVL